MWPVFYLASLIALHAPVEIDSDKDGLSDFAEVHKYFTDPASSDSDKDGIPDGDWNERREFTYSVRAIMHVLPPIDANSLCDDYQDGRVLEARADCVEIEVVCYPFNTNAEALDEIGNATAPVVDLARWLAPGPTANWDEELQSRICADLKEADIGVEGLSDRALVERVSKWLFERARGEDSFTTFTAEFVDGRPRVHTALSQTVERELSRFKRSLAEQWDRELFGKGMYLNATHGTCGSSSIYLSTCLKALGIATRTIICIPVIDASDPRELALIKLRLTHPRVRKTVASAARAAGNSWSSHTFNEVYVGGRWHRLNYSALGQNILDPNYLGLMVHVNTFRDYGEAGLVAWGLRTVRDRTEDVFGGSNPYSCASLSDQFGAHSKIAIPVDTPTILQIKKAYWLDAPDKPSMVEMRNLEDGGHFFVRVEPLAEGDEMRFYADAYAPIEKDFVLKAAGHPDVRATAKRGYWIHPPSNVRDFYVHIPAAEFARMQRNVPYSLAPVDTASSTRWSVGPSFTLTRR